MIVYRQAVNVKLTKTRFLKENGNWLTHIVRNDFMCYDHGCIYLVGFISFILLSCHQAIAH